MNKIWVKVSIMKMVNCIAYYQCPTPNDINVYVLSEIDIENFG